jgi:hypothetical protein
MSRHGIALVHYYYHSLDSRSSVSIFVVVLQDKNTLEYGQPLKISFSETANVLGSGNKTKSSQTKKLDGTPSLDRPQPE